MHPIDFAIITLYMTALIIVGVWFQKKASKGIDSYFLGNRQIPWWVLGASGMASNLDIAGTMIIVAFIYAIGAKGFYIEIRGGVTLIMAFLMIFMGKWNRRAGVMTLAEWMELRFGKGRQGSVARLITAISSIIITIAMITYFAKGAGKFVGEFLGIRPELASLLMIIIAMIYTVSSGLYGVTYTDLFQGLLIGFTIIFVCIFVFTSSHFSIPESFSVSVPLLDGGFQEIKTTAKEWINVVPKWRMNLPGEYAKYNLFGIATIFYLFKVTIEGSGGTGGYMIQRYFAAKSDKEAGLLSLFWTSLLSLRWPFIASIAIMGISYGVTHSVIADPEAVLPIVINNYIPLGIKGLLVAGLIAAAMSTFDSTVNAGAAYFVKDIYQRYLKPEASEKSLMLMSRLSSIVIVVLGLLFSFTIKNINEIWGWITMGIGAGLMIPQLIRWYWWRLNGYGFAIGTFVGMTAGILQKLFLPNIPEYFTFIIAAGSSLIATIIGTLLTTPTDEKVLDNFYRVTRPFGAWNPIRKKYSKKFIDSVNQENRRDIFSIFFAVPWQICLFLMWMMLMMKNWTAFGVLIILVTIFSIVLYFSWFRFLSTEAPRESEDNPK
jgi:Na+/proline symporter